jgi:hypothetical protein
MGCMNSGLNIKATYLAYSVVLMREIGYVVQRVSKEIAKDATD